MTQDREDPGDHCEPRQEQGEEADELALPPWATEPPITHYGPRGRRPFRFVVFGLFGLYVVFDLAQRQELWRSALAVVVLAGVTGFELYTRRRPTLDVHEGGIVLGVAAQRLAIPWTRIVSVAMLDSRVRLDLDDGRELDVVIAGIGEGDVDEMSRRAEAAR